MVPNWRYIQILSFLETFDEEVWTIHEIFWLDIPPKEIFHFNSSQYSLRNVKFEYVNNLG